MSIKGTAIQTSCVHIGLADSIHSNREDNFVMRKKQKMIFSSILTFIVSEVVGEVTANILHLHDLEGHLLKGD